MEVHRRATPLLRSAATQRRRNGTHLLPGLWVTLVVACTTLAPLPTTALPAPPAAVSRLSAGMFLVAKPQLRDPRFQKTVILITAHTEQGTMGLIINRPTPVPLREALPQVDALRNRDDTLFLGGPVGLHSLSTLIRSRKPPQQALQLLAGTYFLEGLKGLKAVLAGKDPKMSMRSYVGYSGWSRGQLRAEIAHGDWLIVGADSDSIFDKEPARVWPELMRRYAGKWI